MLIEVALPVPVRTAFTYSVPTRFRSAVKAGVRVKVPFGRRRLVGVVLGLTEGPAPDAEIKPIEGVIDAVPAVRAPVLEVARWIASYYLAPIGESVKMALPPSPAVHASATPRSAQAAVRLGGERPDPRVAGYDHPPDGRSVPDPIVPFSGDRDTPGPGHEHDPDRGEVPGAGGGGSMPPSSEGLRLARLAPGTEAGSLPLDKRALRLRAVLDTLAVLAREDGWMRVDDLLRMSGATTDHIRRLQSRGWIETATVDDEPARWDSVRPEPTDANGAASKPGSEPASNSGAEMGARAGDFDARGPEGMRGRIGAPPSAPIEGPVLTPAQSRVAERIVAAIDEGEPSTFVLRGVTGSGKTEVYFAAARRALDRGRGAIFLVPEIGLTPVFTRRVRERFGEQVALLHSRLSRKERQSAWSRIESGQAPLVVGPRSALFAPIARLGLIVVDEEHDPSYKQEEAPRYHARDIALVRARIEKAVAVLGSATPSVETWHAATSGRYHKLELEERIAGRPLPVVEIVDMREEFRRRGAPVLLSSALTSALIDAKERGEQAVILLNRRGYAAFALCRGCGEPAGCPHCSVSLVYHRSDETLQCHYCDHRRPRPDACELCGSPHIVFQGEGTERLERHLERSLPGVRVLRLDRDTARARGAHEKILREFEDGAADILVGTQMVAKGHDFPGVTVVGVLAADAILGFPDFRAAERTFQLLTQVAGRAGRGDRPGRVLVQAYRRDHYALRAAATHDHDEFHDKEILYRRALAYPPFTNLASVTVQGKDLAAASQRARAVVQRLVENGRGRVRVLGPALAPIARLRGVYRFQILLKAQARGRLNDALGRTLDDLSVEKGGTRDLIVDVDPQQLL